MINEIKTDMYNRSTAVIYQLLFPIDVQLVIASKVCLSG